MLFDSLNYLLFLPVVFIFYYLLPFRFRWIILLFSSFFFYMFAGVSSFSVPIIIVLTSFFCGILIDKNSYTGRKKIFYLSGLFINIGLLAFYKYINFFIVTVFDGFDFIKNIFRTEQLINHTPFILQLIVPLGISYISFQAMGYLIEIYRGNQNSEKNLGLFATYLLFFPKLLSGPIERAHKFIPQLSQKHEFDYDQVSDGLKRILWGLFKKLVVSNHLSIFTATVFNDVYQYSGITLIFASFFFMLQLYADFSGYTDIAIGSAQILGYRLMENFNNPLKSKSTTELWRRWHISLSTWFYEYVFNPIVINRRDWNQWAVVYASIVTFLLLGFWHGASWNFIIFGLIQGFALSIEFLTKNWRKKVRTNFPDLLNTSLGVFYVICFLSFSLIFFKAKSFNEAIYISTHLFTGIGQVITNVIHFQPLGFYLGNKHELLFSVIGICLMLLGDNLFTNTLFLNSFKNKHIVFRWAVYYSLIVIIAYFGVFETRAFIYAQF